MSAGPPGDLEAVLLTAKLAAVATLVLLVLGTPLAWWLSRPREGRRGRGVLQGAVEALVALPLVLPPTVLGFYLLVLLAPSGPVGSVAEAAGLPRLVFSFPGLVVGSVLFSMPFVVQPLADSFRSIGAAPLEAAATLRAGPFDSFFSVVLPLARRAYLGAAVLAFAHTVGEFGVVLMIGGNIPGRTQVLSIALFQHVEALEYGRAHRLALGLLGFSFAVLLLVRFAGVLRRSAAP